MKLKSKFVNHLIKNGNKKTCEKNLLKSFKSLQKVSKKPFKKIFQLSIVNSTPIFRITVLKKKIKKKVSKEVPTFVTQDFERISWGIKYVLNFTKKSFSLKLYSMLKQEILLNAKNKGNAVQIKTEYQKQAVLKKRLLSHFRW